MEPDNSDSNEASPKPVKCSNEASPKPLKSSNEGSPEPGNNDSSEASPEQSNMDSNEVSPRLGNMDSNEASPVSYSYQDRNPSPPPSDEGTTVPDSIGSTLYSKPWLFGTLTKLIEFVERRPVNREEEEEEETSMELDEDLEDDLCKVWDMSMNEDVALFLKEFGVPDLFVGVINKSRSDRLTEICVGILGNMCCHEETREMITENEVLWRMLLLLLSEPDPPTLLETSRLLLTCLSHRDVANIWLNRIKTQTAVKDHICFIMRSSTNADLLLKVGQLVDKLFDMDSKLMIKWVAGPSRHSSDDEQRPSESNPPVMLFIPSWLEAAKQLRVEGADGLHVYLRTLHLLTIVDGAYLAIVKTPDGGESIWNFLYDLLMHDLCQPGDPPLMAQQQKTMLCSVLGVLSMMFIGRTGQEFLQIHKNLQLIDRTMHVLHHVELHEDSVLEQCKKKRTDSDSQSLLKEDHTIQIFKDICHEFLADMLNALKKDNITACFQEGYLNERKCCKAIKYIVPNYQSQASGFIKAMSEVDGKLSETLQKLLPLSSDGP